MQVVHDSLRFFISLKHEHFSYMNTNAPSLKKYIFHIYTYIYLRFSRAVRNEADGLDGMGLHGFEWVCAC